MRAMEPRHRSCSIESALGIGAAKVESEVVDASIGEFPCGSCGAGLGNDAGGGYEAEAVACAAALHVLRRGVVVPSESGQPVSNGAIDAETRGVESGPVGIACVEGCDAIAELWAVRQRKGVQVGLHRDGGCGARSQIGNGVERGLRQEQTKSLIGEEEEGSVPGQRAAQRAPKIVLPFLRFGRSGRGLQTSRWHRARRYAGSRRRCRATP